MNPRPAHPETAKPSKPLILIVEDQVLIRLAAADVLREQGYAVAEAGDAAEAMSLLQGGVKPDLVISDIRMPGEIDGVELGHRLKEWHPYLPVILTSSHLPEDREMRADGFLSKPFEMALLLELVARRIGAA